LQDDLLGLELPVAPGRILSPDRLARPVFAIAPGAHHYTKRWPADRYALALAELVMRTGGSGVILGGTEDELVADEVLRLLPVGIRERITDLTGATDWQQTAAAIASADVLIANDSVAGHIAAAVGTPVVSIFGSTSPVFGFVPFRVSGVVEEVSDLECRPCTTIGRAECPLGHFRCMLDIETRQVVESVMRLVQS
jgi:heptosyltransferase-2